MQDSKNDQGIAQFDKLNLLSKIPCTLCIKNRKSFVCRPETLDFDENNTDEDKNEFCKTECDKYYASKSLVNNDICYCINTDIQYEKCKGSLDPSSQPKFCQLVDDATNNEDCLEKCNNVGYEKGSYQSKYNGCICKKPFNYSECSSDFTGSCQIEIPIDGTCDEKCNSLDYTSGETLDSFNSCVCKDKKDIKSTENFANDGLQNYLRKCNKTETVSQTSPGYSPIVLEKKKKKDFSERERKKTKMLDKAFCACESGGEDSIIKQNEGVSRLFDLWNNTIANKNISSDQVLNSFQQKIDTEYEDSSNLSKAIAYLMCQVNNQNELRTNSPSGILNKISYMNSNDRFNKIFKYSVYLTLVFIIFKTFYPTTMENEIPFENSLIYAMLFPYSGTKLFLKSYLYSSTTLFFLILTVIIWMNYVPKRDCVELIIVTQSHGHHWIGDL